MLFIITVCHNRKAVTQRFAGIIARQSIPACQLILVDDGSTDGTAEAVQAVLPSSVILRGDGSLWWAGGLQKGLNWLTAQNLSDRVAVAFMNDDTSFADDYCEKAVNELLALPAQQFLSVPGVFQPSGRKSDECGITRWSAYRYAPFGFHPERINHSTTRTLFIRWGDLKRIGGFHPTLLPHYLSDYEFTHRAFRKGLRIIPARTVVATFFDETTGQHRTHGLSLPAKIRLMLSPRFSFNPAHHFVYVWYSAPWYLKIPCWSRILLSTLKFLVK